MQMYSNCNHLLKSCELRVVADKNDVLLSQIKLVLVPKLLSPCYKRIGPYF